MNLNRIPAESKQLMISTGNPVNGPMLSPRKLLKSLDKRPIKRLGQHFLVHEHSVKKILDFAEPEEHDVVLEIGAGLGALTFPLAHKVKKLYAVELDTDLVKLLREQTILHGLENRIEVIEGDILKVDIGNLVGVAEAKIKVLGNLPYNISSPVLFKLWENSGIIERTVVMLQREVAERLIASPGSKDYGILTVLFAYKARITKGFSLKPEEFYPAPKVGSMVVSIDFGQGGASEKLTPEEEKLFTRIVRTTFGQRRKMLRKSLPGIGREIKDHLADIFAVSDVAPDARPETLTVDDFCRLAREIYRVTR